MPPTPIALQRQAQSRFLGRGGVIGVGLGGDDEATLVVLLEREAPETVRKVSTWASQMGAKVAFDVVGQAVASPHK